MLAVVVLTMKQMILQILEDRAFDGLFGKHVFGMEMKNFVIEYFQSEASRRSFVHG